MTIIVTTKLFGLEGSVDKYSWRLFEYIVRPRPFQILQTVYVKKESLARSSDLSPRTRVCVIFRTEHKSQRPSGRILCASV